MFSELKKQVLDVMCATGLLAHVGAHHIHATADQALARIYAQYQGPHAADALQPVPAS
jgi:hypothetical protein